VRRILAQRILARILGGKPRAEMFQNILRESVKNPAKKQPKNLQIASRKSFRKSPKNPERFRQRFIRNIQRISSKIKK